MAKADGSEARQVTYLGAASFAPSFFPSGNRILFSSNYGDPKGREFDLWAVNLDGTGLERSPGPPASTASPCSRPTATASPSPPTATRARRERPTSSWPAGWTGRPRWPSLRRRRPDRFRDDVRWLADDAREGRGIGTAGPRGGLALARRPLPRDRPGAGRRRTAGYSRASTCRWRWRPGRAPRWPSTALPVARERFPARRFLRLTARSPPRWWPPATASPPRS